MDTLGKRIQSIRKKKKMTLVDVAADKMTKGMLSLIENDKAQPSIENLQHIAKMLNTDISSLTNEFPPAKLRELLDEIHVIQRANIEDTETASQLIIDLVKPIEDRLPLCYETAQIIVIYIKCFSRIENYEEGIIASRKGASLFKEMSLYNEYLQAIRCIANNEVCLEHYEKAFNVLQEAFEISISDYYFIHTDLKISIYYDYAASAFAIGNFEIAKVSTTHLIETCHKNKAYFFYSNSLRLAATASIIFGKMEEVEHYRKLLDRFTEFDQTEETELLSNLFYLIYYNLGSKNPEMVIIFGDKLLENKEMPSLNQFVYLELGKAYYQLGEIDLAYNNFKKYKLSQQVILHPIDQAIFNESYAYYSLVLKKLGKNEEATTWATLAFENSKKIVQFFDQDFINNTYKEIVKNQED